MLIDDPGRYGLTPKDIEHERRDKQQSSDEKQKIHQHFTIQKHTERSPNWRELLQCRTCKRRLTEFLSGEMVHQLSGKLNTRQRFITAGGLTGEMREHAAYVDESALPLITEPALASNAEESDMRIWLHFNSSSGHQKVVYSPDTDVYHIDFSEAKLCDHVYIQLTRGSLNHAVQNDPDLMSIGPNIQLQVLQTLYVVTGCDYVSFFKGFLNTFFQHASFISSGDPPGTLSEVHSEEVFLSFLPLVGTVYFNPLMPDAA